MRLAFVPQVIREEIASVLGNVSFSDFSSASGGCINQGGQLITSSGNFFLKWNDSHKYAGMFKAEAHGLALLAKPNVVKIPRVVHVGDAADFQFLLLEFIEPGVSSASYWETLGKQLALMHQNKQQLFGLDHPNYIGSLKQFNIPTHSWADFFIQQRLAVQVKDGRDNDRVSSQLANDIQKIYKLIPDLITDEKPALLHGDLWSGNVMVTDKGEPCLIDPAVYYGNREVDLAMTQLFGGFANSFLSSYQNVFPLQPGYQERFDLYNLYPLLVHVNLFGSSYTLQVKKIVDKFIH